MYRTDKLTNQHTSKLNYKLPTNASCNRLMSLCLSVVVAGHAAERVVDETQCEIRPLRQREGGGGLHTCCGLSARCHTITGV